MIVDGTTSLSVVIPVYNEPDWIRTAVGDLVAAIGQSPLSDVELVVVDDGSDEPTRRALAELEVPFPYRVVRQPNRGRFAARLTGLQAATKDLVLLQDARVSLAPDALRFVAQQMGSLPDAVVWNGHVDIDVAGNPYARFWNVLTELAFRAYFDDPMTTDYGPEDFDRYPKGTTCFLAPRDALLRGMRAFTTYYADTRDANDDTTVIRSIAEEHRIHLSPGFRCTYRSRDNLPSFIRHALHRGAVFVDGHVRSGSRYRLPGLAFFPGSVAALTVAARRPHLALAAVAAGSIGIGLAARAVGRDREDAIAIASLGAAWLAAFGGGMWRGAALAARARLRDAPLEAWVGSAARGGEA